MQHVHSKMPQKNASTVKTLWHYTNMFIIIIMIFTFSPSVAFDPKREQKLEWLQDKSFTAGMTCHLINKEQRSHGAELH